MLRGAFALSFGLMASCCLNAQPMPEAAAQLASRTSFLLPRRATVSLELQNLSARPAADWANFRTLFEAELRKTGIEIASGASAEPHVRVTLSESARGMLLVSEITSGENRQVAMLPWNPPQSAGEKPRVTLTKTMVWTQPEPILDMLLLDSNSQMLVLSVSKVASFRLAGGSWTPSATASLVLPRPVPRDPRGRIEKTPDGFRAYLPGATCTGSLQPDLKISCATGNETWPDAQVRWVTDRNVLESDAVKGSFYTSAQGLLGGAEGWGSDIAPIQGACGAAVIATSTATDRDSVQAYQNTNPVSDALPLPGPVTALWPFETPGQVTLVVHNLQTGEYEASRLGLACSQ